jgi:L-asparaginase
MANKKVYIAYTGGTIGMKPSDKGFVPEPGYFTEVIHNLPKLLGSHQSSLPDITVNEYDNLIDSSDITPEDWYRISQDIESKYQDYDGFVVLHGTDTMAYTASALSFMLQDLSKPVVVTGSQIPWSQIRTDARDNLITSLMLASQYDIPEVAVFFHDKLYRGNRVRKIDANGFHAFESPNFPPLADIGTTFDINQDLLLKDPEKMLSVQKITSPKVAILTLFPGFQSDMLESLLQTSIKGLVLMTYGTGNAPAKDKKLLKLLERANRQGIVIVNCTQCYRGSVNMTGYANGQELLDVGVISGSDMTPEATLTKLSYLLSCHYTTEEIKQKMQTNLRGELSD